MSIHFINPIDSIEFAITLTQEKKNCKEKLLFGHLCIGRDNIECSHHTHPKLYHQKYD